MRAFADYNPLTIFMYYMAVLPITMFCMNPIILSTSLIGSVAFFCCKNGKKEARFHVFCVAMFVVFALINPLFYHNGVTVLFILNNNPVTLESLLYGVSSAVMIVSVLYWFRTFSQLMTSDRLQYLFGVFSPKLSLIFSLALRYIPLFSAQIKKINQTQKTLGLYKEDNAIDNIRGGYRVFSIMATWSLENGIITADSMSARGYGAGRRTFFSLFRFRAYDFALLAVTLIPSALVIAAMAGKAVAFTYYPAIQMSNMGAGSLLAYVLFAFLALIPTIIEVEEHYKWQYLKSKI